MNRVLVALALAGWAALPTAARANVSLTFAPAGYVHSGPNASLPLNFQLLLTLTNAAVANGRFDLSGVGPAGLPPRFSGDVAEFVSLAALGDGATPSSLVGTLGIFLTFDSAGALTSDEFTFLGSAVEFRLSGDGGVTSGYFGQDFGTCNASITSRDCFVSGSFPGFTPARSVPEPGSLALFSLGLAATLGHRRRRATPG